MRVRSPSSFPFQKISSFEATTLFLPFLRIFLLLDLDFRTRLFDESDGKEEGPGWRPSEERESKTRRFRNDITARVKWRGKLAQLLMDIGEKARQVLPEAGDRGRRRRRDTRPIREKFSSRRIASRAVSRFVAKP